MKRQAVSKCYDHSGHDRPIAMIRIRTTAGICRRGWLTAPGLAIPVALGRGGIRANKREGDGATARGVLQPRKLGWRPDGFPRPHTFLSTRTITSADAWCEDPNSRHYNQPIRVARGHK